MNDNHQLLTRRAEIASERTIGAAISSNYNKVHHLRIFLFLVCLMNDNRESKQRQRRRIHTSHRNFIIRRVFYTSSQNIQHTFGCRCCCGFIILALPHTHIIYPYVCAMNRDPCRPSSVSCDTSSSSSS